MSKLWKRSEIGDFVICSGPAEDGTGWYVDLHYQGRIGTWLLPVEARSLAKALIRHSRRPSSETSKREKP